MDLIRTLLVYMSLLLSSSAVSSPAMTPVPPSLSTPTPAVTATAQMTAAPTSLPTITPTATPTRTPLLAVGDRGEDVRRLQARLQELGYLGGKVDGIFGKQTKAVYGDGYAFELRNAAKRFTVKGDRALATSPANQQ